MTSLNELFKRKVFSKAAGLFSAILTTIFCSKVLSSSYVLALTKTGWQLVPQAKYNLLQLAIHVLIFFFLAWCISGFASYLAKPLCYGISVVVLPRIKRNMTVNDALEIYSDAKKSIQGIYSVYEQHVGKDACYLITYTEELIRSINSLYDICTLRLKQNAEIDYELFRRPGTLASSRKHISPYEFLALLKCVENIVDELKKGADAELVSDCKEIKAKVDEMKSKVSQQKP